MSLGYELWTNWYELKTFFGPRTRRPGQDTHPEFVEFVSSVRQPVRRNCRAYKALHTAVR